MLHARKHVVFRSLAEIIPKQYGFTGRRSLATHQYPTISLLSKYSTSVTAQRVSIPSSRFRITYSIRTTKHIHCSPGMRQYAVLRVEVNESGKPIATVQKDNSKNIEILDIQPSYPEKPKAIQNLVQGLNEILVGGESAQDALSSMKTAKWILDSSGEGIHRHLHLSTSEDVTEFAQQIERATEELHHHPHLHVDGTELTVTCATHVPPGLSVKDVKLAKKVNELYDSSGYSEVDDTAVLESIKEEGRKKNMEAVKAAKASCSCG